MSVTDDLRDTLISACEAVLARLAEVTAERDDLQAALFEIRQNRYELAAEVTRLREELDAARAPTNRLELRYDRGWELWRDRQYAVTVAGATKDALIEACAPSSDPNRFTAEVDDDCQLHFFDGGRRLGLVIPDATVHALAAQINRPAPANPPRLILPPGVIHGSDGKFYAPTEVVEGLDEALWQAFYSDGKRWNGATGYGRWYEVRPTTANPLPTLPDTCWQIPDGRICCLRKDAQALRDMGWTTHYTKSSTELVAVADCLYPEQVVEARPPAKPDTERVPLHELIGRCIEPGQPVTSFTASEGTREIRVQAFWPGGNATIHADADGKVEVLAR